MIPIPEVTDVDIAFPASVKKWMPDMKDIPEEFKDWNRENKWTKAQSDWFFNGIKKAQFTPKSGVDAEKAFRVLACIQGSFEPKHEHKKAAVAYLMSQWFDDYKPVN